MVDLTIIPVLGIGLAAVGIIAALAGFAKVVRRADALKVFGAMVLVVGVLMYASPMLGLQAAGIDTGAGAGAGAAGAAGGIVVSSASPVLKFSILDAMSGANVTGAGGILTTSIASGIVDSNQLDSASVTLNKGSDYKAEFMPTATYYYASASGVLSGDVTYASLRPYLKGTATCWTNNDPSNATVRNASGAQESWTSDQTKNITIYCQQNSGTNYRFGETGIVVELDYNNSFFNAPVYSNATIQNAIEGGTPTVAVTPFGGALGRTAEVGKTTIALQALRGIANSEIIAIPLSIQARSSVVQNDLANDFNVNVADIATYRDSVTNKRAAGIVNNLLAVIGATNATATVYAN